MVASGGFAKSPDGFMTDCKIERFSFFVSYKGYADSGMPKK